MKTILITGVAGLMGSRMADWIIEHHPEYRVVGIDNLSGGYKENINPKVIFIEVDCCDKNLASVFTTYQPNVVYHFAAYAAEGLSPFIRKYNYHNNLIATANIVNNCITHDIKRLIFTSSMAVYGAGIPPFSEEDIPNPIDPYGVAKFACEMDIKIAGMQHNLDWCIIRPHNVYGIKKNIWDKYRNVLGIWMNQYLNKQPMTIFGNGEQKRAFTFIDDCLEPLWNAGTKNNTSKQIINIGSGLEYSINKANEILKEVVGGGNTVYLESRHEVDIAHSTWDKSVALLNYQDITNLQAGITIMWNWAKQQVNRKTFTWDKYEIEKGMYSFWKGENDGKSDGLDR